MTDLGTLGGLTSAGFGINNSGQITGTSWINNNPQAHAFLYAGGVMHDIGTLGGPNSQGFAINDVGQITGESATTPIGPPTNSETHAFLYSGGTMTDLGTFGGGLSAGLGINRNGAVVGKATGNHSEYHAFLYADNTLYDLTALVVSGLAPGTILYEAYGINDSGQIVANGCFFFSMCLAYRLDPVVSPPTPILVPALSNWALGALVILLLVGGTLRQRRIKR
jgi:probable HAF family extracellular repeat protein